MPFDVVKPLEGEQTFVRLQEVSPNNNKPNNDKTVYNDRKPPIQSFMRGNLQIFFQ